MLETKQFKTDIMLALKHKNKHQFCFNVFFFELTFQPIIRVVMLVVFAVKIIKKKKGFTFRFNCL